MTGTPPDDAHDLILRRLLAGDAPPEDELRDYLRSLGSALTCGALPDMPEQATGVVDILATNASWKVRQEVAELLLHVPETTFASLAGPLQSDSNRYVSNAAKRNVERRVRAAREAQKATQSQTDLADDYAAITRQLGERQAVKMMRLLDRRFGGMTAALAHDLLGMIAAQEGSVGRLRGNVPAEFDPELDLIESVIDDMTAYIRAVHQYTQALTVDRQLERIDELVGVALQRSRRQLEARGLGIESGDIQRDRLLSIEAEVSRELIVQAVTNVLVNAFEAMSTTGSRASGKLTISAIKDGEVLRLRISDSGEGMSADSLKRLHAFLPGIKNSRKRHSSGLGLMIAKRNLDAHDGDLRVESEIGVGTTVTLSVPLTAKGGADGSCLDR